MNILHRALSFFKHGDDVVNWHGKSIKIGEMNPRSRN